MDVSTTIRRPRPAGSPRHAFAPAWISAATSRRWRGCAPDDMLPPTKPPSHHAAIHRKTASPQGRPAAPHRRRPLQRRRQPARPGLCPRPALAARACAHPLDRHRGGARHAGRAGGADRRGREGRRAEGHSAHADPDEAAGRHPAGQPRRLAARLRAAGAAADRPGALRRPAGRHGGGGDASPPAKDAAERVVGGLRAARAGRRRRAARPRSPARRGSTTTSATSASTPTSATSRRPRRRSRAPRMSPSSTPGCIASPACRSTRAPRSASTTRRRTNTRCTPAPAAWCGRRPSLPTSSASTRRRARRMRRRRRQLRHPQRVLSGIRAGGVGGEAPRPPGEMDLRALGGVRQRLPGPRPGDPGRACARRQGPLPRDARLDHLQHRRAQRDVRAAGEMLASCSPRSIACRRRTSAPARRSPTRCRPIPTAAPDGPRRFS